MKTSPRRILAFVSLLALAAASCAAQDPAPTSPTAAPPESAVASAPSAAPSAQPAQDDGKWITPGPAFDESPLFADQKLDAIAKKLEGAWFVDGNGAKEAWEIKGNVAIVATKRDTTAYALKVTSPCTLEMKRKDGMSVESHFVFDGDTLYTGMGDFGVKQKDGTVIACISNGVYVFKKNKCDKHISLGGSWRGEPAKCAVTKEGFEVTGDTGGKLKLHGAALMSDEPDRMKAEKVADLAAGKAKLAQ